MITRIFAAALFALLTVTTPARAATILNLDLDFGNGYQEIGSVEFFGGPGFLFGYQGCCGLNVYYNGTPLSPFTGPVGGIPPQPNSAVGLFDIGGSPVAFGLPLSNTQKFPYLTFADFSLIGTPAVSGDVSIVPLPAALPLFRSEWANAFHGTADHPQRDKTCPAANATT